MKKERVVISTHNSTMRTAFRLLALLAPLWAVYILDHFMGVFGYFLEPIYFDVNERIYWLLGSFAAGLVSTAALMVNSLILSRTTASFPPLKALHLPIDRVELVTWFWHPYEKEIYLRFHTNVDHVDIHHSRLSPKKLIALRSALKKWAPNSKTQFDPEDLEDLVALRERFYKPKSLNLVEQISTQDASARSLKSVSIDIPYDPHEQLTKFKQSLGENEKYFWYCWVSLLLIPFVLKIPDIVWGVIADSQHKLRFVDVPPFVQAVDQFTSIAWALLTGGLGMATVMYYEVASTTFFTCFILAMSTLSAMALVMFIMQPNGIKLRADCLQLTYSWQKIVLFSKQYRWRDMVAFDLDQFGDNANPEKWRLQIKMVDGSVVNLSIEAIKGSESREKLLKTMSEFAPNAVQDPALIRALMPAQRESYTELWLQSLTTPPQRNRLTPLSEGQRLKAGKYVVDKQLATGGQGVAYVAHEAKTQTDAHATKIVLKEFVLPVYTSRSVRKQALERFENEARILEEMNHPQIVKLLDFFLEDHRAYLALEHIDGLTLRQMVATHGRLSLEQIKDLARQMCDVLEYLHSLEPPVVHRDFTPDNLILDSSGRLVLIDFNVAQQKQWTTTSTVVGKHAYLPAEQFRGKPTTQSDLYAMGATLFFLFTGIDPQPISCSHPSQFDADAGSQFDQLVASLTAVEAADRPGNASEVRTIVENISVPPTVSILVGDSAPPTVSIFASDLRDSDDQLEILAAPRKLRGRS